MKYNPYSISKIGTYIQCPYKFKLQYIDKIKVPFTYNLALYKGSFIHEVLENNFNYNIDFKINDIFTETEKEKAVKIIKNFESSELGNKYKKLIPLSNIEEKFGFIEPKKDNNYKIYISDFWDNNSWFRGAIDLYYVKDDIGIVVDWKSGKDHSEEDDFGIDQAMMYAIYIFSKYPTIKEVKAFFVFVEHNTEKRIIFSRSKLNSYLKHFYTKTKTIETDSIFKEEVSALCEYCDFHNHNHCTAFNDNKNKTNNFIESKISLDF